MAPKRKGVSVNLRDLQREMGVGAAMLLPSAPKPVDEADAERGRYGGGKDGERFGGGGSAVRWADRDSDDDDEWRRDDDGQTNGVVPRGQRSQPPPELPDEPWRSAPRPAAGGGSGEAAAGRASSGAGGHQRSDAAGPADEDWGVLRSAARGGGGQGEGDSFRTGGGRDEEEIDFSEVRRAAPQQRKQLQHQGSAAVGAEGEDTLDFAALRTARSTDRPGRGGAAVGDNRPEHLRSLRSRLAEKAAEKLQQQQQEAAAHQSAAGGAAAAAGAAAPKAAAAAPEQISEGSVSSPSLRAAPPSGTGAATSGGTGLGNRTSSLGLGQAAEGGTRPARYVPPSKRNAATGGGTATAGGAAINSRAAAFLDEDERRHQGSARAASLAAASPPRPDIKKQDEAPASAAPGGKGTPAVSPALAAPAAPAAPVSVEAAGSGEVLGDVSKQRQEKEDEKVKEGRASTAATAAGVSPAAGTPSGVATPVSRGSPAGAAVAPVSPPAPSPPVVASDSGGAAAAGGDATAAAGETQKVLPRWKQRLEQRRREQEAAGAGGASSGGPEGTAGAATRERGTTAPGTALGGGAAAAEGGEALGGAAAAPLSSSSISSHANTLLHEGVVQLQPVRLGSGTRRLDAGGGREGKFVPPSLRQQQQQHGGLSGLSGLSRGPPSDVQRIFLQAAAAAGHRRGQAGGGALAAAAAAEKRRPGVASSSLGDATAAEGEKKKEKKKERELEKERQRQEALLKEKERQEKLWKHEESEVHAFAQLLEETLAALAAQSQESKDQKFREDLQQGKKESDEKTGAQPCDLKEQNQQERKKGEEKGKLQHEKLLRSKEEGGVLSEGTLKGIVPSLVVAAALMKRCVQTREMEEVREEVQRASFLWKELLKKSEVEHKDQVLIKEMARAVKAVKCPRLSPSVSLIEALWDAMVATQILPDTAFIKWFEDDQDESEGRTEVLFQVVDWCLWLQGDLRLHNKQDELEDEAEEEDIEALVPKRGVQKN